MQEGGFIDLLGIAVLRGFSVSQKLVNRSTPTVPGVQGQSQVASILFQQVMEVLKSKRYIGLRLVEFCGRNLSVLLGGADPDLCESTGLTSISYGSWITSGFGVNQ